MKKLLWIPLILMSVFANEYEYELGNGYEVSRYVTLGGYFSAEYEKSKDEESAGVDDIAFLVYGELDPKIVYLIEYEAARYYIEDIENDTLITNRHFHIERAYIDYIHTDSLDIRVGKMITPIGYWNLIPINVLRDTTSNPRLSKEIYPKFITGINLNGYLPFDDSCRYALFFQHNQDMDEGYNNFNTDEYKGASITKVFEQSDIGFNLGEFENEQDNSKNRYLGVNYKYGKSGFEFLSEAILSEVVDRDKKRDAFYMQASQRVLHRHSFVGRYEYFDDKLYDDSESRYILGYNYRPLYPISLKAEYQINSDSEKNAFLASFSILF